MLPRLDTAGFTQVQVLDSQQKERPSITKQPSYLGGAAFASAEGLCRPCSLRRHHHHFPPPPPSLSGLAAASQTPRRPEETSAEAAAARRGRGGGGRERTWTSPSVIQSSSEGEREYEIGQKLVFSITNGAAYLAAILLLPGPKIGKTRRIILSFLL